MKKVLIADDEFLVRLGLKTTINWEENGFVIVGEAKNGKEALEFFEKYDPDILLTDIRMPIMGGLELIQELKARKKSLKSVILSHYDDFNYAREAIKLGASEYILKSDLSAENLLEVMRKLAEEIDAVNDTFTGKPGQPGVNTNDDESSRQEFLARFVAGGFRSAEEVQNCLDQLNGIFKYNSFVFIHGVIEDINGTSLEKDDKLFSKTIRNISGQVFSNKNMVYTLYIDKYSVTLLINTDMEDDRWVVLYNIRDYLLSLKKQMKQFFDVELRLGISNVGNISCDLVELFEQSKTAQQKCFFEESGIVAFEEEANRKEGACPQISLEILRDYIKSLDVQHIDSYIDSVFAELYNTGIIDYVKDVFIDFLSYARIIAAELKLKNSPALSDAKFSYSNFDKLYTFESVKKYLIDIFHSIVDYMLNCKPDNYSFIVSKSINFIKAHYQRNISLSDVAEHVEISSSYLSLLFKQETGINFSSFITNYRVEMSKKLLVESNMKIYEIAEKVGFENPYYFSKVFKEITGFTCKDFKRNHYLKESFNSKYPS